jgi:hypothetical protein
MPSFTIIVDSKNIEGRILVREPDLLCAFDYFLVFMRDLQSHQAWFSLNHLLAENTICISRTLGDLGVCIVA